MTFDPKIDKQDGMSLDKLPPFFVCVTFHLVVKSGQKGTLVSLQKILKNTKLIHEIARSWKLYKSLIFILLLLTLFSQSHDFFLLLLKHSVMTACHGPLSSDVNSVGCVYGLVACTNLSSNSFVSRVIAH